MHQLFLPEQLKLRVDAELLLAGGAAGVTFSSGVILSSSLFHVDFFFGKLLSPKF